MKSVRLSQPTTPIWPLRSRPVARPTSTLWSIDRDTVDVCLDHYGHVTLEGNRRIALRIPGIIEPLMADPRPWDTRVELRVINPE